MNYYYIDYYYIYYLILNYLIDNIYDYFKNYPREEVDIMLSKLTPYERQLVIDRYTEDLSTDTLTKLTREQIEQYYLKVLPKMKKILSDITKFKNGRIRGL